MASPYYSEFDETSATKGQKAAPLRTPTAPTKGGTPEPDWMPKLAGARRTIFKALGRKVKTRTHEDF